MSAYLSKGYKRGTVERQRTQLNKHGQKRQNGAVQLDGAEQHQHHAAEVDYCRYPPVPLQRSKSDLPGG